MLEKNLQVRVSIPKVGVFLTRFSPASAKQTYLLEDMNKRENMLKASRIADRLNKTMGKDMVRFAAMGYDHPWKVRQAHLSGRYITRVNELLIIKLV
jgi:DNA polymerase V